MDKEGFKVKYFKDTIIGMRAVLTYNHLSESLNRLEGTIQEGKGVHRFSIKFDSPITFEDELISSFLLVEGDEIYLIPD
jgi:hypothetical protein